METKEQKVVRENLEIGTFVIFDEDECLETKRIFVYGTLRKGEGLNPYLNAFKFLGVGILKGYLMYTNRYFPMIVEGDGEVVGEVYEIKGGENEIEVLDRIESGYTRTKVKIKMNKKTVDAETYIYKSKVTNLKLIESGNWLLKF